MSEENQTTSNNSEVKASSGASGQSENTQRYGGRPGQEGGRGEGGRSEGGRGEGDRRRGSGGGGYGTSGQRKYRRKALDVRSLNISYTEPEVLERFISKTGKILPQRVTGATAKIQRKISREIRRARMINLLPFNRR